MTLTLDNTNLVRFFSNGYHRGDCSTFARFSYANGDASVLHVHVVKLVPRGGNPRMTLRTDC